MKSAVIFGATGQSGSYLAEELCSRDYDRVIGVARRTSLPNDGRLTNVLGEGNFELVKGDITDAWSVNRIVESAVRDSQECHIFNLAAQSHVHVSFDEPVHTTNVVYGGALNVLEAIRNSPHRERIRVYQASSSEMFGTSCSTYDEPDLGDFPLTNFRPQRRDYVAAPKNSIFCGQPFQDELTPMIPCSPYAVAKLAAHNLVSVYRKAYGVFACSGILHNHESPRRGEEFVTRKITKYIARYAKNNTISPLKLGNLKAGRDWGFAGDYVQAMRLMLEQDTPDDYVVATGEVHTVENFVKEAFSIIGVSNPPVEIDPTLYRPVEVPLLRGDASKARAKLKWQPNVTFRELVRMMVEADIRLLETPGNN